MRNTPISERLSDWIVYQYGSWPFIVGQNVFYALWALLNVWAYTRHWDEYPWMGMNLIMSWVAANSGSFVQMSNNRQSRAQRRQDLYMLAILETLRDHLVRDEKSVGGPSTPGAAEGSGLAKG